MKVREFTSLFLAFVGRDLAANRLRSLLTILSIALGVSVFLAISLANDTALSKFAQTVDLVAGKSNLQILPQVGHYIDEEIITELLPLAQAEANLKFTPVIDENVTIDDATAPGKPEVKPPGEASTSEANLEIVQLLGLDMLGDPDFRTLNSSSENDSDNEDKTESGTEKATTTRSIFSPNTCYVGAKLAQRLRLKEGSIIQLHVNSRMKALQVTGILSAKGLGGAYSGNLLLLDIGCAQEVLELGHKLSRVDLIVKAPLFAEVKAYLKAKLPETTQVVEPGDRFAQAQKMTRSFEYNLLALTFIALMVGFFLIYNTMTITVLRRRPEIGILRVLGVTKREVWLLFFYEALGLGVIGSSLGLALGGTMAGGALKAVSKTFQQFYFKVPLEDPLFSPEKYFLAFLTGVGLTLLGAAFPLWEATTVEPAEATKRGSHEVKFKGTGNIFLYLSLGLFLAAYLAYQQGPIGNFPVYGYLCAFLCILASSLAMPWLLRHLLPQLAQLSKKVFGPEAGLAALTLNGTLLRTSVASASLMIGIAMMVSLAIMISSFRKTVTVWIDQSFQADLWLQSKARSAGNKSCHLPPAVLRKIRALPEVAGAEGYVDTKFEYQGIPAFLAAADFDVLAEFGNQLFLSGRSNKEVCQNLSGNKVIISEPFAVRKNLKRGQSIELPTNKGPRSFSIEDIFYDYASDLGYVIMPRPTYIELFNDSSLSTVAVYLKSKDKEGLSRARQKILTLLQPPGSINRNTNTITSTSINLNLPDTNTTELSLSSTAELRAAAIKIFDRTFAITYALHTIAIVVALLSVMNALFALTIESKRDFAILRYLGATARQLAKIVYLEAAILALVGNAGGIALGYLLSLVLVFVINKQSFGWSVQYSLPLDFILESTFLVLLTAVLSAWAPARIAAKTLAPQVIRDE